MIAKSLEQIAGLDIEALVTNQVAEGRTIEYKRDLPGGSDGDKKEFLADVSSLANTIGGDLLLGVDEAAGIPTQIVGVQATDLDAEVRRLDSILLSGVEPRIRYSLRRVVCSGPVTVLVVRVEQSWLGPHRVTFKGHDKFYARTSAGKYALDVDELRQAFLRTNTVADRIRSFRESRLIEIGRDRTPVPLVPGARLILHFVPLQAFASVQHVNVARYYESPNLLPPMGQDGWSHRITVEGILTYSPSRSGTTRYTHLYRAGIIEAVDAYILNQHYEGERSIPSRAFEEQILKASTDYLKVLNDLGTQPPVYVFLSLLGVKGCRMGVSTAFDHDDQYPIEREVLELPEVVVSDFAAPPASLMKGPIDLVWNACGFPGSPNFDAQGKWQPRR